MAAVRGMAGGGGNKAAVGGAEGLARERCRPRVVTPVLDPRFKVEEDEQ